MWIRSNRYYKTNQNGMGIRITESGRPCTPTNSVATYNHTNSITIEV